MENGLFSARMLDVARCLVVGCPCCDV